MGTAVCAEKGWFIVSNEEEIVFETEAPSPQDEKWFEFVENAPFDSNEHLSKFAEKALTLASAAVASYLALSKFLEIKQNAWFWIPLVMFLLALIGSLMSIFPKKMGGSFHQAIDIKEAYLNGLHRRGELVSLSLNLYILGVVFSVIVVAIDAYSKRV